MKLIYKGMLYGGVCAKVYLNFKEFGSSVQFPYDGEPYHVVTIGCAQADWVDVHDSIMHEMLEFTLCSMELAYQRWYRHGSDSGDIWFHFSHADYSEAISRASQAMLCFVDEAEKEVDRVYQDMLQKSIDKTCKKVEDEPNADKNNG